MTDFTPVYVMGGLFVICYLAHKILEARKPKHGRLLFYGGGPTTIWLPTPPPDSFVEPLCIINESDRDTIVRATPGKYPNYDQPKIDGISELIIEPKHAAIFFSDGHNYFSQKTTGPSAGKTIVVGRRGHD